MNKNKKIALVVIAVIALGTAVYFASQQQFIQDLVNPSSKAPQLDDKDATEEETTKLARNNNQFAFKLYDLYREKYPQENIFYSPYSISTALAMTYEGAEGETAQEIADVFNYPEDSKERRANFAKIHNSLNDRNDKYQLSTANAIWPEKSFTIEQEYIDTITEFYGGKVQDLDYINSAEESRETINTWVEEQTEDKIKNLFPKGSLDEYTRLVLTNAIYFKGTWVKQFDKENTQKSDFNINNKESVEIDMMSLSGEDIKFNYYEEDNLQAIELPYEGGDLSMIILLPSLEYLDEFEQNLTAQKLSKYKDEMQETELDLYLPKFKMETKYSMVKDLSELGMPTAFTDQADFTKLSAEHGDELYITQVIHQAFVEVNEEGTEAAAATGVAVGIEMVEIKPVFKADHPFIFFIQDKETQQILFMGKVVDPS